MCDIVGCDERGTAHDDMNNNLCSDCYDKQLIEQGKAVASLSWALEINCPYCDNHIDLACEDDDAIYSKAIFNNKWGDLKDEGVYCPACEEDFLISEVEY